MGRGCVAGAFLLLLAAFFFLKAVNEGLNHDEQQFVAPPVLLAKSGALPYRDFALLHMPNLVFAYAALDHYTSWHFLVARLFNASCAWTIVALVFAGCHRLLSTYTPWPRLGLAVAFALLLCTSTLAIVTNGRTWNHDPALLPVVLAFFAYVIAARGKKASAWLAACGCLVGVAIGTRLTFAPIVAPFGLAVLLLPVSDWRQRMKLAAFFSLGVFIALLPAIYFLGTQPEQFLYGNVQSQRLRLIDPTDEWARKTATLWRKVRYFFKVVMARDWPLFGCFFAVGVSGLVMHFREGRRSPVWSGALLLALLLPFVFSGALAPTRFQHQHYYALTPFLVLATAFGMSQWRAWSPWAAGFVGLLAVCSVARAGSEIVDFAVPREFARWVPVKVHRIGQDIARRTAGGRVLTLAPIHPLEGGARIYHELAVGPFAYRLAHLLPEEKRPRLRVCAPEDLPAVLAQEPPAAILLGAEDAKLETALRQYGELRGYVHVKSYGKLTLWIAP